MRTKTGVGTDLDEQEFVLILFACSPATSPAPLTRPCWPDGEGAAKIDTPFRVAPATDKPVVDVLSRWSMGIEGTRYEELSFEVLTEVALVYSDGLVACAESAAMNDGDENEAYRDLRRELRIQLIEMMVRVGMHEVAATRTMNRVIEMVASGALVPGSSRTAQ